MKWNVSYNLSQIIAILSIINYDEIPNKFLSKQLEKKILFYDQNNITISSLITDIEINFYD